MVVLFFAALIGWGIMVAPFDWKLGTLPRDDRPGSDYRSLVSWFSHRDAVGFFRACVERPNISYEIVYGASNNTWKIYDTPYGWEVLGFTPADNASDHWRKE